MNKLLFALALFAVVISVSEVASAHIEVGADLNADGDCDDAGEHVADVPVEVVHMDVCVP